jgi:hypothetical protein
LLRIGQEFEEAHGSIDSRQAEILAFEQRCWRKSLSHRLVHFPLLPTALAIYALSGAGPDSGGVARAETILQIAFFHHANFVLTHSN